MSREIELQADDWCEIAGRGPVATFRAEKQPVGVHPRDLVGQQVVVDGKRYVVKGVEHFAIECPRSDTLDKTVCGHPFGLLLNAAAGVVGNQP